MKNLVLLCPFHHRLVHEGGFTIAARDGRRVFVDPRGRDVPALAPQPRLSPDPLRALRLVHVSAGTRVDDTTLLPKWYGDTPDIGECVAAIRSVGRSMAAGASRA